MEVTMGQRKVFALVADIDQSMPENSTLGICVRDKFFGRVGVTDNAFVCAENMWQMWQDMRYIEPALLVLSESDLLNFVDEVYEDFEGEHGERLKDYQKYSDKVNDGGIVFRPTSAIFNGYTFVVVSDGVIDLFIARDDYDNSIRSVRLPHGVIDKEMSELPRRIKVV